MRGRPARPETPTHCVNASDDRQVRPLPLTGDVGAVVRLVASMAMATLQNVPNLNSGQQPRELSS